MPDHQLFWSWQSEPNGLGSGCGTAKLGPVYVGNGDRFAVRV
jgi:hypothetical protein